MMDNLLRMVEDTDNVELACDEVFELLDQYIEMEKRGEDAAHLLPLVKRHLDKCQDCREEYEALARMFDATS
jgi:predicted anti-sigma-YlaC factor YlaD